MQKHSTIELKNARVHNLKGVSLSIPRDQFIVITGLSGSGKSSLAFDTLYAEGQRRYVESLSSYVRQFLGRMNKPEVDSIKGLPPAIAIEQKVISNNIRSTVGTTTEIYEYLKLIFARIGKTISPISHKEVTRHSVNDIITDTLDLPEGTPIYIRSKLQRIGERTLVEQLEAQSVQGFARVEVEGEIKRIAEAIALPNIEELQDKIFVVIDRMRVQHENKDFVARLYDSVETAFFEGKNTCYVDFEREKGQREVHEYSKRFEADGMVFEPPTEKLFSFNTPIGACEACEGTGIITGIDRNKVIPDQSLSIFDHAIAPWRGTIMQEVREGLIKHASKFDFPIHKPYFELTEAQKELLWTGNEYFEGLNAFFDWLTTQQYKIQFRVMLSRYRGKTRCNVCHGTRLRKEATWVEVGGKNITELVDLSLLKLQKFFKELQLTPSELSIVKRPLIEIKHRIQFLLDVGLGYLTLNRPSNTLSGGESQRINLATSLGSALIGSLYILDEPSIGLHPRDTANLIKVLRNLQRIGNTVIVVEHDEMMLRQADYIIDIGPDAGKNGGEIVMATPTAALKSVVAPRSWTLKYLRHELQVPVPKVRRPFHNYIEIIGACQNNLKNVNVKFPLNIMTCITGVSGSGKSSLVTDVLYNALRKSLTGSSDRHVAYGSVKGSLHLIKDVQLVGQSPIGTSSRSNPVTYIKAYDDIRALFASQQLAQQMGLTPKHFSFNVDGGRCENCKGEGTITIEMQFMADLVLPCEVCHGTRFKRDILEVKYKGQSISDILKLTVTEAIALFSSGKSPLEKRIAKKLKPLADVGIGYIQLGQASSTLSGGEAQRVKLAYYLTLEKTEPMVFIFDEPTTGLHTHDINTLLKAFQALLVKGHTLYIIEHNLDIIKSADYVIDIGPEGGEGGGKVVFTGTPEALAQADTYTGYALKALNEL